MLCANELPIADVVGYFEYVSPTMFLKCSVVALSMFGCFLIFGGQIQVWKAVGAFITILAAVLLGYMAYGVQLGGIRIAAPAAAVELTYTDLVSISLTVFGVIIAVASIALAVAGVIGWNSIEGKAMSVASSVIKSDLNDPKSSLHRILHEAISDVDSPLHKTLKAEAQKAMFAGIQSVDGDNDEMADSDNSSKAKG